MDFQASCVCVAQILQQPGALRGILHVMLCSTRLSCNLDRQLDLLL